MTEQLELIFQNIDKIAFKYNIPFSCYKKYKNKYHEYKAKLSQAKTNGHFVFCPWSNPRNMCGPNTCPCSRLAFEPDEILNGLAASFGPTLIISVIKEINSKKNDVYDFVDF